MRGTIGFSWRSTAATLAAALILPATAAAQQAHGTHSNGDQKAMKDMKDIVTVAVEAGSFTTLVTAVKAAGLVETLKGPGPFTVFAPSDAAFAKVPKATLDALLADKEALTAVLTYHVVPGRVAAKDIVKMGAGEKTTVNGAPLSIKVDDKGGVWVDGARVTTADIPASNGVIHVIDAVVLPKKAAAGAR